MSHRNPCLKTRPVSNPYEIWQTVDGRWTWKVLKKYQADDDAPYARWFCLVISPFVEDGELGDVYASDIRESAQRIA